MGQFPDNIWFAHDRDMRPHTNTPSWTGWATRREYDQQIVAHGVNKTLLKGAFASPKKFSQGRSLKIKLRKKKK